MIGFNTNMLVSDILQDDPGQSSKAINLIQC